MPTTALEIRPAVPDDLADVARIYAHYVEHTLATFDTEPPTLETWHDKHAALTRAGWPFLVATGPLADDDAPHVLGFAYTGQYRPKAAYGRTVEETIYLDPAATGQGLGGRLLDAVLDGARDAGAREVIAVIADGPDPDDPAGTVARTPSATLHERHGFGAAGRLEDVGHKHGRWVAVTLYQRSLRPPA
ncbi:GNAT family N-acetyltransferase [Luteimicrobium xylanilyticum]|uniref:Phosphinothricin acetyltransferase n=1 Tax=Luteimicrobium xylanilyticum TaxID=1133546 RepID=A0A5P9Q7G3_9MICO|nr:GNAT family N-acetyltransferase [Luteimicrobium xylanilyticum]QFU97216.1 Phosphinothricin acetyltransferase [Luteimicrobium xylanilyticum]